MIYLEISCSRSQKNYILNVKFLLEKKKKDLEIWMRKLKHYWSIHFQARAIIYCQEFRRNLRALHRILASHSRIGIIELDCIVIFWSNRILFLWYDTISFSFYFSRYDTIQFQFRQKSIINNRKAYNITSVVWHAPVKSLVSPISNHVLKSLFLVSKIDKKIIKIYS